LHPCSPSLLPGPGTVLDRPIGNARLDTTVVTASALAMSFPDRLLAPGRTWAYPFRLPMPLWARGSWSGQRHRSSRWRSDMKPKEPPSTSPGHGVS
jgi:hypothetical protein